MCVAELEQFSVADINRQDQDHPAPVPGPAPAPGSAAPPGTAQMQIAAAGSSADQPEYQQLLRPDDLCWVVERWKDLVHLATEICSQDSSVAEEAISRFVAAWGLDYDAMVAQESVASRVMQLYERVSQVCRVS